MQSLFGGMQLHQAPTGTSTNVKYFIPTFVKKVSTFCCFLLCLVSLIVTSAHWYFSQESNDTKLSCICEAWFVILVSHE